VRDGPPRSDTARWSGKEHKRKPVEQKGESKKRKTMGGKVQL